MVTLAPCRTYYVFHDGYAYEPVLMFLTELDGIAARYHLASDLLAGFRVKHFKLLDSLTTNVEEATYRVLKTTTFTTESRVPRKDVRQNVYEVHYIRTHERKQNLFRSTGHAPSCRSRRTKMQMLNSPVVKHLIVKVGVPKIAR